MAKQKRDMSSPCRCPGEAGRDWWNALSLQLQATYLVGHVHPYRQWALRWNFGFDCQWQHSSTSTPQCSLMQLEPCIVWMRMVSLSCASACQSFLQLHWMLLDSMSDRIASSSVDCSAFCRVSCLKSRSQIEHRYELSVEAHRWSLNLQRHWALAIDATSVEAWPDSLEWPTIWLVLCGDLIFTDRVRWQVRFISYFHSLV